MMRTSFTSGTSSLFALNCLPSTNDEDFLHLSVELTAGATLEDSIRSFLGIDSEEVMSGPNSYKVSEEDGYALRAFKAARIARCPPGM